MSVLELSDVSLRYRERRVVRGVSVSVGAGQIVLLAGCNGAGKSTVLRCSAGAMAADPGNVLFDNCSVNGVGTTEMIRRGVSLLPAGKVVFSTLSVADNLKMGDESGGWQAADDLSFALKLFPDLRDVLARPAGQLSGGQQRIVGLARTLTQARKILLLDEPLMGLGAEPKRRILRSLEEVRQEGVGVLLADQSIRPWLRVADRMHVLFDGVCTYSGPVEETEVVRHAYFGGTY